MNTLICEDDGLIAPGVVLVYQFTTPGHKDFRVRHAGEPLSAFVGKFRLEAVGLNEDAKVVRTEGGVEVEFVVHNFAGQALISRIGTDCQATTPSQRITAY